MKKYEGINYGFRPDSYWVDKTIRQSILRDIKGTERGNCINYQRVSVRPTYNSFSNTCYRILNGTLYRDGRIFDARL